MASITIRRLEDSVKEKLRIRAANHGRSMEEEAREILKAGLAQKPAQKLSNSQLIRQYIEPFGGVDLVLPKRSPARPPIDFE